MFCRQASPKYDWKHSLRIHLMEVLLLMSSSLWSCVHVSQVTDNSEAVSQSKIRPIEVDIVVTERVGQEALEKIGYDEIIKLAEKADFVEYQSDERIQLVAYGSVIATSSVRVFSRYALAAAVTQVH